MSFRHSKSVDFRQRCVAGWVLQRTRSERVCLCLYCTCVCFVSMCTIYLPEYNTVGVTVHRQCLHLLLTFAVSQTCSTFLVFGPVRAAFLFIYFVVTANCCDFYSCRAPNFASINQVGRCCRGWVPAPLCVKAPPRFSCRERFAALPLAFHSFGEGLLLKPTGLNCDHFVMPAHRVYVALPPALSEV